MYGIFHLAQFITQDEAARTLVQSYGYFGVVLVSYIAGLNAVVPVPAVSFVPVFTAAGLWMPLIITMLIIGTTLADLTAYYLAALGRQFAANKHPRIQEWTDWLATDGRDIYIAPFVFIYATISPFPNEVILVPLALAGIRLRVLIIPLLLGNIVFQTAFALGFQSVFDYLIMM